MLFWKIGSSSSKQGISLELLYAATIAVCIVYILSLLSIKIFKISSFKAGTFSQACYRFNTYIGMAIVINILGEPGIRHFGILISFIIPFINILAVSTLIWHSSSNLKFKTKATFLIKALVSNPLIIGCLAGIAFSRSNLAFPIFVDNTLSLMTSVTLPPGININWWITFF